MKNVRKGNWLHLTTFSVLVAAPHQHLKLCLWGKEFSRVMDPAVDSLHINIITCIFHCLEKRHAW